MSEDTDSLYGDIFGPLQHPLNEALMNAVITLPSALDAQVHGQDGPVSVPPDQLAEMLQKQLLALVGAVPQIAGALDIARTRITRLEQQLAELKSDSE